MKDGLLLLATGIGAAVVAWGFFRVTGEYSTAALGVCAVLGLFAYYKRKQGGKKGK